MIDDPNNLGAGGSWVPVWISGIFGFLGGALNSFDPNNDRRAVILDCLAGVSFAVAAGGIVSSVWHVDQKAYIAVGLVAGILGLVTHRLIRKMADGVVANPAWIITAIRIYLGQWKRVSPKDEEGGKK